MRTTGPCIAIAVAVAVFGWMQRADADDNVARADQLFNEGKELVDKDLNRACAKFEESLTFNSQAIGTLLNVALCDEKLGRFASAVARFTEARDRAKEGGMVEHQQAAEDHIAEDTPKVPHLTIQLAESLSDTKIVIDDKLIPLTAMSNLPVDPGPHAIEVSAPGRIPYQTKIQIAAGEHHDVPIPPLGKAVTVSSRRTIGKISAIAGGGAIVTGVILGFVANASYQHQFTTKPVPTADNPTPTFHCTRLANTKVQCDADGFSAANNALTLGNVGTVVMIVGVGAAVVGSYIWLRSPGESSDRRVSLLPQVGPDGAGIVAMGRF